MEKKGTRERGMENRGGIAPVGTGPKLLQESDGRGERGRGVQKKLNDTRIAPVRTGQKLFFDGTGGDPANKVERGSCFVVGSGHPSSSEGLLAYYGSCALVVYVCLVVKRN